MLEIMKLEIPCSPKDILLRKTAEVNSLTNVRKKGQVTIERKEHFLFGHFLIQAKLSDLSRFCQD